MAEHRISEGLLAYSDRGEGPALVLLHAFPLNGRMWEPQAETFKKDYRVVMPDYPGFGRSARAPAQPDVGYYARCVQRLVDSLGLESFVLGGISMGGYVAFQCLRHFPGRIRGLVLADTRADADPEEARETRMQTARRVAEKGVEVLIELQMERLLAPQTIENNEEVVERVRAMIRRSTPEGVVGALGALRDRPDVNPLLPEVRVPTLVIGGEEDAISSPEVMGEMARGIPTSRHVVIPGAGHLSNLEAPQEFNAALQDFLETL